MLVARAQWFHYSGGGKFDITDGTTEDCRCSCGPKILTVWLPMGAKIRCRRSSVAQLHGPIKAGDKFVHYYGFHERGSRTKIVITVAEKEIDT